MRSLCLALALAWLSLASGLAVVEKPKDKLKADPKDKPKDKLKADPKAKPKHTAKQTAKPAAKHAAKHAANQTAKPAAKRAARQLEADPKAKPKHAANQTAKPAAKHAAKHAADQTAGQQQLVRTAGGRTGATHPRYARTGAQNVETVWQRPRGDVKGVFFIAHGCGHQATDIFSDTGPDGWEFKECKNSNFGRCLGLPEEVAMVKVARNHGYLVMATSGGTGRQSCFDATKDPAKIQEAIKYVLRTEGLPDGTHILATGASSGGFLMGALAGPLAQGGLPNLKCIAPQISGISTAGHRGVPTIFVHMPKDKGSARQIEEQMRVLKAKGTHTTELQVKPSPIEKLLPKCVINATAQKILAAFRRDNFTDEAGYLNQDARRSYWQKMVSKLLGTHNTDTLRRDESCLSEIMNVAWAQHEFTAEYSEEIVAFCEKKLQRVRMH